MLTFVIFFFAGVVLMLVGLRLLTIWEQRHVEDHPPRTLGRHQS